MRKRFELKGRLPFRLGTTSWIVPGDIVPNAALLSPLVDDVELVLFESGEASNLPAPEVVDELRSIAAGKGLTYTVHLPLDADPGDPRRARRARSVEKCARVLELTRPLDPFAYILHLPAPAGAGETGGGWAGWRKRCSLSIRSLLSDSIDPSLVCVENLDYPFEAALPILDELGLSACLDAGHLLMRGLDPAAEFEVLAGRTRVVHLHGIREGRDHRDLGGMAAQTLGDLLDLLAHDVRRERTATIEVFDEADLEASFAAVSRWASRRGAGGAGILHPDDGAKP